MRCRSAIPAPPRRFRKTHGWRPRKCIGGTITIIGGTAGTIIIATTIIVTGIAGEGGLIEINGLASPRAYFHFGFIRADIAAIKGARMLRVILATR
jgi:hypothetical protein